MNKNKKNFLLRLPAAVIDGVFKSAVSVLICAVLLLCGMDFAKIYFVLPVVVLPIVALVYEMLFEMLPCHATPGKLMLGIYVSFGKSGVGALKALLRILLKWLFAVPCGLGFISGLFFSDRRTLYDRIAGARVTSSTSQMGHVGTPYLIKYSGNKAEQYIKFSNGGIVIGRNPQLCNVLFHEKEPGISACHCNVSYNGQVGLFMLEDLDSSYGTYMINGERVIPGKIIMLNPGDRFYLAVTQHLFSVCLMEEEK